MMETKYSITEVAEMLGKTPTQINAKSWRLGLGENKDDGKWFTSEDIERLKEDRRGAHLQKAPSVPPGWKSSREVAEMLGCTRQNVADKAVRLKLGEKFGRQRWFSPEDVERILVDKRGRTPKAPTPEE